MIIQKNGENKIIFVNNYRGERSYSETCVKLTI